MVKRPPAKICLFITELAPAGAERCVYQLATGLPKAKYEVHVAALSGGKIADDLKSAGIKVHLLNIRCRFDLPKYFQLKKIFKRENFDLLHTHLFHAGLVGMRAGIASGIKKIVHSEHVVEKRPMPWRFLWARLNRHNFDRIICVSKAVMASHSDRSKISADKYRVIYNGIDTERFRPDSALAKQTRDSLGITDDIRMCLFLGRLDKQKGLSYLLDGFLRAAVNHPKLILVIAGDGPLKYMIDNAKQDTLYGDRIIPLGYRADAEALLNACDFLCMPSMWEGFGLSAAEAMACEKAVIASDIEGLNEVVLPGRSGMLLPAGDTEVLAASIGLLAASKDLRREMGQRGRQIVVEKFSQQKFINAHDQLYSQVLGL